MQRVLISVLSVVLVGSLVSIAVSEVHKSHEHVTSIPPPNFGVRRSARLVIDVPSPNPTPTPTPPPTRKPCVEPTRGPSPTATPAPTCPTVTPAPTPTPTPMPVDPAGVNCSATPDFCSSNHEIVVRGGVLSEPLTIHRRTQSGDVPQISISSEVRRPDGLPASRGDHVASLRVEVHLENETADTFWFPTRRVVLSIYNNGRRTDQLPTQGPGFEFTPTGTLTAIFELPMSGDGRLNWEAAIWYFRER